MTWLRVVVLATMAGGTSLRAQGVYSSDDDLLRAGKSSYDHNDYVMATVLLYAYMERGPNRIQTDYGLRSQVLTSYNFSLSQVVGVQTERDSLRDQLAQTQAQLRQLQNPGSTTSALSQERPKKTPPKFDLPLDLRVTGIKRVPIPRPRN